MLDRRIVMHTLQRAVLGLTAAVCASLVAVGAVSGGPTRRQVLARLEVRGSRRGLPAGRRQGLFRRRGPGRYHRHRPGFAGGDPARGQRRLPVRLRRYQFPHQVPRQESGRGHQGHSDGVRRAAVRDRHAGQDRHRDAEGPGRPHSRRTGSRRRLRAVEGVRQGERHRRQQGDHRETSDSRCGNRCWWRARWTPSPATPSRRS